MTRHLGRSPKAALRAHTGQLAAPATLIPDPHPPTTQGHLMCDIRHLDSIGQMWDNQTMNETTTTITVWDAEYLACMMGGETTLKEAAEMVRILRDRGFLTGPPAGPWLLAETDETDWNAMIQQAVDARPPIPATVLRDAWAAATTADQCDAMADAIRSLVGSTVNEYLERLTKEADEYRDEVADIAHSHGIELCDLLDMIYAATPKGHQS